MDPLAHHDWRAPNEKVSLILITQPFAGALFGTTGISRKLPNFISLKPGGHKGADEQQSETVAKHSHQYFWAYLISKALHFSYFVYKPTIDAAHYHSFFCFVFFFLLIILLLQEPDIRADRMSSVLTPQRE